MHQPLYAAQRWRPLVVAREARRGGGGCSHCGAESRTVSLCSADDPGQVPRALAGCCGWMTCLETTLGVRPDGSLINIDDEALEGDRTAHGPRSSAKSRDPAKDNATRSVAARTYETLCRAQASQPPLRADFASHAGTQRRELRHLATADARSPRRRFC